jgi:peptidoglycan/LPS O-acetylase OafA/YrhL
VILLTAYEKNAIAFTIARMVRLYPAYWICVTLTALAMVITGKIAGVVTPKQYLANLTMAHSYFGVKDISGVYWTLAVELKFYFLIFLVLAIRQAGRIGYLLGAWLVASILLSLQAPGGILRFFLFPEWSSYFIAGAMLFLIHREGPSLYKFCVIAGCYLLSAGYAINLLPAGNGDTSNVNVPLLIIVLAMFYLIFLGIALRRRSESNSNAFYVIGLITYPLYLIHQDIGYILFRSAPSVLNPHFLLCVVIFAMIVLSWAIHVGPEKWLAKRLKGFLLSLREIAGPLKAFSMRRSTRYHEQEHH